VHRDIKPANVFFERRVVTVVALCIVRNTMNAPAARKPTAEQFDAYRGMYAYFNAALFAGELPEVLLNLSRRAGSMGFYSAKRWEHVDGDLADEISINPDVMKRAGPREVAQTLVHEMCHLWREHQPEPNRRGYHDHVWSKKMEDVGLMPSSTGKPGGRRVGQKMADYPIEGGLFLRAYNAMPSAYSLPWRSDGPAGQPRRGRRARPQGAPTGELEGGEAEAGPRDRSKLKYSCPGCGINMWGKEGLAVACIGCVLRLVPADEFAEDNAGDAGEVQLELGV
jgi:hypothetical protein